MMIVAELLEIHITRLREALNDVAECRDSDYARVAALNWWNFRNSVLQSP
jgi:hypothetical protein